MKKEKNFDFDDFISSICPESVFKPEYPYIFKFNLLLGTENYGEISIQVKEELKIFELSGEERALKKLFALAEKQNNQQMIMRPLPMSPKNISFPFKGIDDVSETLLKEESFRENADFEKMLDFILNTYSPINHAILKAKTGIQGEH